MTRGRLSLAANATSEAEPALMTLSSSAIKAADAVTAMTIPTLERPARIGRTKSRCAVEAPASCGSPVSSQARL